LACNTYTFSNQPAGQTFFFLEIPAETFTVAFGENTDGQINVPNELSNAVAVAGGAYFSLALENNGTVIAWGDNTYGQTTIPAGLANVVGIAAGEYHGVAVLANGSVTNWGTYYSEGQSGTNVINFYCSVTNRAYAGAPPTSGVIAVAAGEGQDLALMSNGTCVAWGLTNVDGMGAAYGTQVPSNLNLTNVSAVACGQGFNLALSSNGTVTAWGQENDGFFNDLTNVPSDLTTNVAAIAAGGLNSVALKKNGTVEAWGDPNSGVTNVPAGLSNVVAVATGGEAGLALQANGNVVAWGEISILTNIPEGMFGVKAISAGFFHNLVIESGILNPVIFTQPANQYAPSGSNVTFSALGLGVAGVTYQWQSNGMTIAGATGATLTLSNVVAGDQANYDVVVTTDGTAITSSTASFTLVVAPQVGSTSPPNTGLTWINYGTMLSVDVTNAGQLDYPISYSWQLNGTSLGDYSDIYPSTNFSLTPGIEGVYTVGITNVAGGTNVTWDIYLALPGMVESWGSDNSGECNRPATVTNVAGIAAGEYQSVAVTDTGTVLQWGQYSNNGILYSVTSSSATQPPTNGVVAVAAGLGQALALTTSNTVIAWGLTGAPGATIPTGVQTNGISAIACGSQFDLALSNGIVIAWGNNSSNQTSVPSNLSNVTAIAAGAYHVLALSNGTVVAWGATNFGQTTVPAGLTNVVAVAAGDEHSLALQSNGKVTAWGNNSPGQINVPAGLSNVMAIAAGNAHSVALLNNGTLVAWGADGSGQAATPAELPTVVSGGSPFYPQYTTNPAIVIKLIAAGGNHTMAAIWAPTVQYPVHVSKDVLLIYNASSTSYSSNVCAYYMAHRPMISTANLLGISCVANEGISWSAYTSTFVAPIVSWLSNNPTLRPQYVILFQDLPSRVTNGSLTASVQYDMHAGFNYRFSTSNYFQTWTPFVTAINMNGTNTTTDCIAYINKLTNMAGIRQTLLIGAPPAYYGSPNWYFDDANASHPLSVGLYATEGVESNGVPTSAVTYTPTNDTSNITKGTNVAGYSTWGANGALGGGYATNGTISFFGASTWYLIATVESFNGQRVTAQGNFLDWYSSGAFSGLNYSNTPVGAISHVDEPTDYADNTYNYFGLWAAGKSFAICAWAGQIGTYTTLDEYPSGSTDFYFQAVGDPFVIQ
jgi:alpha-tubulin suppressor-like RCC1 family protein